MLNINYINAGRVKKGELNGLEEFSRQGREER